MECAFHFLSFSVQNSRKIGLDKGVHCSNVAPLIVAREKILRYCYHIVVYVFYLLISYERLEVWPWVDGEVDQVVDSESGSVKNSCAWISGR